jgi:hypothetical protein
MTDIVERLRSGEDGLEYAAADEIERLCHDLTIARLDRDHAQRLVNDARGERDEAVATLAIYRMEHGCTRGQRTTQWCGEAIRLREALRQLLIVMPVFPDAAKKIVGMEDRYNAALDAARAALKETGHEA